MMDGETVATLKALMEWEGSRKAPPPGFPRLPDGPAARYTSAEFHALEQEHIFRKTWLFAAHLDEVPEPGSFMRWNNAGDPIIIVHGTDGVVRAFYNTCRHRGAPVVTADKGCARRLVCPYHAWTYKTDGTLIGVPERQDFVDLDMATRGLIPVRCERFGKLIFPNWVSPLSNYFVPPLIFWPTSRATTRLELITMAPDWGDGEAPDLWTVPDETSPNGRAMAKLIQEDTQFGEAIQRSMESRGFQSVPLSYQESRIYWFHQHCDRMIGAENIPSELRVEQVIADDWVWPNDPRLALMLNAEQEAAE